MESFDKLFEVGIRGVPVLVTKSTEIEKQKTEFAEMANGFELGWYWMYGSNAILRIDHDSFLNPNRGGVMPSENYYVFWKYAKEELPKIASSDMSADEKLDKYVKFGLFAVPYVKEEIAGGQSEYEKYFALVGAHLTTADYMKVINSPDTVTPMPTEEEIESSLLESAKNFDYKQWLAENEEDLNNLFEFFDEYVKEYEAKAETEAE